MRSFRKGSFESAEQEVPRPVWLAQEQCIAGRPHRTGQDVKAASDRKTGVVSSEANQSSPTNQPNSNPAELQPSPTQPNATQSQQPRQNPPTGPPVDCRCVSTIESPALDKHADVTTTAVRGGHRNVNAFVWSSRLVLGISTLCLPLVAVLLAGWKDA